MTCRCKPGAGCWACCGDSLTASQVRNRQLDELEDDMITYRHLYYCEGRSPVTDAQYDMYEDILRRERPDSKLLTMVGCPCKEES